MKRITKIRTIYGFWGKEYHIELEPNYFFDFNGLDYTTVNSVNQVFNVTKHIVFCNGL